VIEKIDVLSTFLYSSLRYLDVSFGKDKSKIKKGNAPKNLNFLRKTALQTLKQTEEKQSIKNKNGRLE
jgi:predicted transposase YbfD/YdcC